MNVPGMQAQTLGAIRVLLGALRAYYADPEALTVGIPHAEAEPPLRWAGVVAEAAQVVHWSGDVRLDQMATQNRIAVPGQQTAL